MHMSIDLPINCIHPAETRMTMGADGCTLYSLAIKKVEHCLISSVSIK